LKIAFATSESMFEIRLMKSEKRNLKSESKNFNLWQAVFVWRDI
jgi:hypothetical protein